MYPKFWETPANLPKKLNPTDPNNVSSEQEPTYEGGIIPEVKVTPKRNYFLEEINIRPMLYSRNFRDDLTMPIATGNRAERIMDRIDRRADRAVGRIENGRMNVRRWDRLGNQHAKDLGRLNEINSVRWDLHLPESRRNAREAVLNYLNSIGMNEAENLPKYPWHY